ncbi:hypothetical protein Bbelb_127190 [Branchiostoma belcheri]|nr:hypothetical protein Bbelb_127190 [Branchiostoma belcheri]
MEHDTHIQTKKVTVSGLRVGEELRTWPSAPLADDPEPPLPICCGRLMRQAGPRLSDDERRWAEIICSSERYCPRLFAVTRNYQEDGLKWRVEVSNCRQTNFTHAGHQSKHVSRRHVAECRSP